MALLELRGVGRRYGAGANATIALAGVDLDIEQGEFVAIVGPSGAGKSTMLNVLGLLDTPTSGTYRIGGIDVANLREGRRDELRSETFGFVFQSSHVLPDDSVARNAAVALRIRGSGLREQRQRVARVLDRLGLGHRASATGRSLSGGERQRLALARAISTAPQVVLADEPTGNLDSGRSDEVIGLLRSLNDDGTTVVVITHDEKVAAAAHRRVTVIDGTVESDSGAVAARRRDVEIDRPGAHSRMGAAAGIVGDALSSLTLRPARTLFLLLAVLVGTGGLVAATGLGETTSSQISQRLTAAALDQVTVTLPGEADPLARSAAEQSAVDRVRQIDHVIAVGRAITVASADARLSTLAPGSLTVTGRPSSVVYGGDADLLALQGVSTSPSTAATMFDPSVPGRFAIIGDSAADHLGIAGAGPGAQVWVGGRPVDIIGRIVDTGRSPELADAVFVSHDVTDVIDGSIRTLLVRTDSGSPPAVADAIPPTVDPGDPGSVHVDTIADLRSLRRGVATDLGGLVGALSWVLLGLATISAAAILFVSTESRTAEIGLRRALGASRTTTTGMLLLEGLLIGGAGGLCGIAAGLATVVGVSAAQGWVPVLTPSIVAVGLLSGTITGVVASAIPALRAGMIDPAQAVRA